MNKRITALILSLAIIAAIFIPTMPATAALPYGEKTLSEIALPNWMSVIRDETKLTEITMPGTHDSAAKNIRGYAGMATSIAQCQDLTITQQLNAGVRFFDIRCECNPNDSTIWLVHGSVDVSDVNGGVYYMDTLFKELMSFLNAHPTETVMVSIKLDDGDNGPPALTRLIYEYIHGYSQNKYYYGIDYRYENHWYLGKQVPTLGQVRGKIVLVNRFDSNMAYESDIGTTEAEAGQIINYGGQHDDTYNSPVYVNYYNYNDYYNNTGLGVSHVQDRYKWSTSDKVRATQEMLDLPHTPGEYYISYSSTTTTAGVPNPRSYANTINPQLLNLNYTKNKPSGIYCFDFVNESLTRKIVENNEAVAYIVDGTAGGLSYRLNRYTKTLTISGSGNMPDYTNTEPPWANQPYGSLFNGQYNTDIIEKIVIENGVKSVSANAFSGFNNVKTVSLPSSLRIIGKRAFANCTALRSVDLRNTTVTSLPENAFSNCVSLTEFYTTEYINSIADNTFNGCRSMKMYGERDIYSEEYALAHNIPYFKTDYIPPDISSYEAAMQLAAHYCEDDYTPESFARLTAAVQTVLPNGPEQEEVDELTAEILTAVTLLRPYLNLTVQQTAGGSVSYLYNNEQKSAGTQVVVYGDTVVLNASADDNYSFEGWYEANTGRIISQAEEFTYTITANTSLEARFAPLASATLFFKNQSGFIVKKITKSVSYWQMLKNLRLVEPQIPYHFGGTNGRWEYDNSAVLAALKNGQNAEIIAAYDEISDLESLPDINVPQSNEPQVSLQYYYDESANRGVFLIGVAIPTMCNVKDIGLAYCYEDANDFNPMEYFVALNSQIKTSRFQPSNACGYYSVTVPNSMLNKYNWATRGYVTYQENDGTLKTVYSEQMNLINGIAYN